MTKKPKTNEADAVKLVWKLFTISGCVVGFVGFQLFSAIADQDVQLSGMVSQTQFSQMFAQVQTENRREHDIILTAVAANSEKTETNSSQISKVDSKVSKILGIVELLVDKIKDDDDDD
jgi:uncharacterized membrane protein